LSVYLSRFIHPRSNFAVLLSKDIQRLIVSFVPPLTNPLHRYCPYCGDPILFIPPSRPGLPYKWKCRLCTRRWNIGQVVTKETINIKCPHPSCRQWLEYNVCNELHFRCHTKIIQPGERYYICPSCYSRKNLRNKCICHYYDPMKFIGVKIARVETEIDHFVRMEANEEYYWCYDGHGYIPITYKDEYKAKLKEHRKKIYRSFDPKPHRGAHLLPSHTPMDMQIYGRLRLGKLKHIVILSPDRTIATLIRPIVYFRYPRKQTLLQLLSHFNVAERTKDLDSMLGCS